MTEQSQPHDHPHDEAHAHGLAGHSHTGSGKILMFSLLFTLAFAVVEVFGGWFPIDPLLSLLVSALILFSAVKLLREVVHVLMEGVPRGLDATLVSQALTDVDGVRSVQDLHIWNLSSNQRALAAHIEIGVLADWRTILPRLQSVLSERFGIAHTTLQPEDRATARDCVVELDCGIAT